MCIGSCLSTGIVSFFSAKIPMLIHSFWNMENRAPAASSCPGEALTRIPTELKVADTYIGAPCWLFVRSGILSSLVGVSFIAHPAFLNASTISVARRLESASANTTMSYGVPANARNRPLIAGSIWMSRGALNWASRSSASLARASDSAAIALASTIWPSRRFAIVSSCAARSIAFPASFLASPASLFRSAICSSEPFSSLVAASEALAPKRYSPPTPSEIAIPATMVRARSFFENSFRFIQSRIVYSTTRPANTAIVHHPAQRVLFASAVFNASSSGVPTGYYYHVAGDREQRLLVCILSLFAALAPPIVLLSTRRKK